MHNFTEILPIFLLWVPYLFYPLIGILVCIIGFRCIKPFIKDKIIAEHNKGVVPKQIKNFEVEKQHTSIELCIGMEQIGHIARIKNSLSDYIIGTPFLAELAHIPTILFNGAKPKLELVHHPLPLSIRLENDAYNKIISKLLSSQNREITIRKEYKHLKIYTKSLFLKYATYFDEGVYVVNDIFQYTKDIIMNTTAESVLGKLAKTDKKIISCIMFQMDFSVNLADDELSFITKLRNIWAHFKYQQSTNYISTSISNEFRRLIKLENTRRKNHADVIQLVLDNRELFPIHDEKSLSISITSIITLCYHLVAPRIANFLMDISLDIRVYAKLASEQREIVEKHGLKINQMQLDEMKYLDAALKESIRLTLRPTNERKVEKDYVFSNGSTISKGSVVKFDLFSHSRNEEVYGDDSHSFIPERHLVNGTNLSDVTPDNFIWGAGEHTCPAIKYVVAQLKTSAAIFIRTFEINQRGSLNARHRGYRIFDVVRHVNTKLYLKPHNIHEYQSVFYQN